MLNWTKKALAVTLAATMLVGITTTAFAGRKDIVESETSALCVASESVPQAAISSARDAFQNSLPQNADIFDLSSAQLEAVTLGAGFTADSPGSGSFAFYFPIMYNDEIIGMITVWPSDTGEYLWTMGRSDFATNLNAIKSVTSAENPAFIYTTRDGFAAVHQGNTAVTVLEVDVFDNDTPQTREPQEQLQLDVAAEWTTDRRAPMSGKQIVEISSASAIEDTMNIHERSPQSIRYLNTETGANADFKNKSYINRGICWFQTTRMMLAAKGKTYAFTTLEKQLKEGRKKTLGVDSCGRTDAQYLLNNNGYTTTTNTTSTTLTWGTIKNNIEAGTRMYIMSP